MAFPVRIVAFGSSRDLLTDEVARYIKLVSPWADLGFYFLKPLSAASASRDDQLAREEKLIAGVLPPRSHVAALSEEGRLFTSREFSAWMGERLRGGGLSLVVGSAQGLAPSFKNRCDSIISLSPLTMPYRICMLVLAEQIYRAFTILNRHPYHK